MHVAARIGIAAGGIAVGAIATHQLIGIGDRGQERRTEKITEQTERATADWTSWKSKFDEQFSGGSLDTPADHARFEQFIAANPAPSWVEVTHEGFTRVHTKTSGFPIDAKYDHDPSEGDDFSVGVGGVGVLGGLVSVVQGVRLANASPLATIGLTAGGGLIAAFSALSMIEGIDRLRTPDPTTAVRQLAATVNQDA